MARMMGDKQLLEELRWCKIDPADVEAVQLGYETENGGDDVAACDVGIFSLNRALQILQNYVIRQDDWNCDLPAIALTVWATDHVLYTHDYDGKYEIRSVSRNPPRE